MNVSLSWTNGEGNTTVPSIDTVITPRANAAQWIFGVYGILILVLGTIGNILSMVAMRRPVLWRLPSTPYLMTLAAVDLLVLWIGLVQWLLSAAFDIDTWFENEYLCSANVFMVYFTIQMSGAIVTAISVQRMISISFPLKARIWNCRRNVRITLAILSVVLALLNIPLFFYCGMIEPFLFKIIGWIDFTVRFCIPFPIILISSFVTIVKLRMSQSFNNEHDNRVVKNDKRVTVMLMTICIIYVLCVSPWGILYLLIMYQSIPYDYAIFLLTCFNGLTYLNNATNFIVYFFAAPNFRKAIRGMFTSIRESST